jgi:hypothetical protein
MVSTAAGLLKSGFPAPVKSRSRSKTRWTTALTAGAAWKIVVASAALAATSAAAGAGALPDPVQSAVSTAASRIGIEIPDGVDEPDLGQSDQGEISQPERPDQDSSDDVGIDHTDQSQGTAVRPKEQANESDPGQPQTDLSDESDESRAPSQETDESQEGPANKSDDDETGQADGG